MTIIPNLVQHLPPITHRHLHPMLSNTIMAKIASTAMISAHHNLPNHPLRLVISAEDVSVNSEEEASVTDSEEDVSNEDSGVDAEDMEVSLDNESDEGGNYQTKVDIRTQLRCMGRNLVQARRYP